MQNTIIFRIEVDDEKSYARLANFIYKREGKEEFSDAELQSVTYKYYLNHSACSDQEWIRKIAEDGNLYCSVRSPKDIRNITEKYEVIYCIKIEQSSDIVELYNLFLIKHYYAKLRILVLFEEYDGDSYFKISQFLYRINKLDEGFYNSLFFIQNGQRKRAQLNNISFSRKFTPLQIVDKDNLVRLFKKSKEVLSEEYLNKVLGGVKIEYLGEDGDLLDGGIKLLRDVKGALAAVPKRRLIQIIREMDVFAFILLCYVVCTKEEFFDVSQVEDYSFQMQQYSSAIHQLAENIVFHSKTKCGVIAIRIHEKNSIYMENTYHVGETERKNNFIEVIVSDFCGDNWQGNIAENFLINLEDSNLKGELADLKPRDFFVFDGRTEDSIWGQFHQRVENIGKHFGLHIFQSVVSAFSGFFGAESHSGYISQAGDSFFSYVKKENVNCLPGTRFHIALPLENVRKGIKRQDLSLDSGMNISRFIEAALNYRVGDRILEWEFLNYESQMEKNVQIENLSVYLEQSINKTDDDILYISLGSIEDSFGEILAKALVLALFRCKGDFVIVFYQCSDILKWNIFDTVRIFFQTSDIEGMFFGRKIQIVLYSDHFEELVIDLSSRQNTDNINAYISHMKCIISEEWYLSKNSIYYDLDKGAACYIPCDILHEVEIDGEKQTLFEHYTTSILENSIQNSDFGCKLEHTHMRLGSTIHIDEFYEADILFDNKLFVSRFAMLLVKDMKESIKNIEKLTLYGYGTYSETVLVQMIEMIHSLYPKKKDVDYIILEREEEKRGFLHKDRIRYNRLFETNEERKNYFKDRKIAVIVLINSTLKTHLRLISLFKDENGKDGADEEWLIHNYAVLLVGNARENEYWKLEDKKVILLNGTIKPTPKYFVHAHANYQEPTQCGFCFPENPVAEIPLIEVNAASTIPNQAFGIVQNVPADVLKLEYHRIQEEEERLECLKGEFLYGHVQRNENHFLYYFKTENIWMREKDRITASLRSWAEKWHKEEQLQYNIVVAPMHFSNAGFVELVNNVVFGGNAILLRIDFDKEYRCNAYTKFSYLRNYVEQLRLMKADGVICVHFVDDVIISGRTFHRAKSLVETILGIGQDIEGIEIKIFDKVFVLVDRNSTQSRRQYVKCCESDFYSFVHINISSLRNYGDSCVFCNLKSEADLLYQTASTIQMAEYWEHCGQKFRLYSLEEYYKIQKTDDARAFRRLFCTHMAQSILEERYHGNDKVQTIFLILKLLQVDYGARESDGYEYFLSYLKCISRPFLVFKRAVKEAIFDIMLLLIEAVVRKQRLRTVIKKVEKEKPYLAERRLIIQFNWLEANILRDKKLKDVDKKNLVRLLMKQLTELKSNYIIRPEKMDAIFGFMRGTVEENKEFEKYYMTLISRLVGSSSDTNKSIWLDEQIWKSKFKNVSEEFRAWTILENTRAFRDGLEKLDIMASRELRQKMEERIENLKEHYDYQRIHSMFVEFKENNAADLKIYRETGNVDCDSICEIKKRIQRFIKSLPELPTINFMSHAKSLEISNSNWSDILDKEWEIICQETEAKGDDERKQETSKALRELIAKECDMYQYGNFYKIFQQEGYMTERVISKDGVDIIACCMKVLGLCRKNDTKVLGKVQELATLFKIILHADKIQFIVENKEENNLDEWKLNIEKEYNSMASLAWKSKGKEQGPRIHITGKKHYFAIVERAGREDYNTELSENTVELLNSMNQKDRHSNNYLIDIESGKVIWELESRQRSVWICIENRNWRGKKARLKLKIAWDIRKVMIFYQELKEKVFNPENDDFLNEIAHIRRELKIYNSNKVYTHTKDYLQEMQYSQALEHFKGNGMQSAYLQNYPSYVLNLLADINVSKFYRDGLRKEIYKNEGAIKNPAVWGDISALIGDGREFVYTQNEKEKISVKLRVAKIKDTDEILCKGNNQRSVQEFTLLLYSLILNAAEQGRGKRQNFDVQSNHKSVIVNVYKEENYLIIKNECEESVSVERINRNRNRVPESEEDGISFWSFNCYIKRCINSLIWAKMREINANIAEGCLDEKEVAQLGEWIMKLTNEEFEIQAKCYKEEQKIYFMVSLPIFMEKYYWDGEKKGDSV